jgi:hypothetical protein
MVGALVGWVGVALGENVHKPHANGHVSKTSPP